MSEANSEGSLVNKFPRLSEKLLNSRTTAPDIVDELLAGEGPANIFPGNNSTDDCHATIIVHSLRSQPAKRYITPVKCIEWLEKDLLHRIKHANATSHVKILIDEIHPSLTTALIRVASLTRSLNASLEVDLLPTQALPPIHLERTLLDAGEEIIEPERDLYALDEKSIKQILNSPGTDFSRVKMIDHFTEQEIISLLNHPAFETFDQTFKELISSSVSAIVTNDLEEMKKNERRGH